MTTITAGVDIGGSSIKAVARDDTGAILSRYEAPACAEEALVPSAIAAVRSLQVVALAAALRRRRRAVTELVVARDPGEPVGTAVAALAAEHDLVVVGTIDAGPSLGALVDAVLASGVPTVTVAMRTPNDLTRYPAAPVHLCSYGILPPTMEALAAALFGNSITGRLPVSISGLFPLGHGIDRQERR